jgi:hypothetical protein
MQRYKTLKSKAAQSIPVRSFAEELYSEVAEVRAKANIPIVF